MEVTKLIESLQELAHIEARPFMTTRWDPTRPGEWLELRCKVKPDEAVLGSKTDRQTRLGLHRLAEEVVGRVEANGWRNLRAPRIELGGDLFITHGQVVILHECEVSLEICPSEASS